MQRFSLKYKFIITLVAFTVLLSVSLGVLSAHRLSLELREQFMSRGLNLVNSIADQVVQMDRDHIISALESAQRNTELIRFLEKSLLQGEFVYFQVVQAGSPTTEYYRSGLIPQAPAIEPINGPLETREGRLPNGSRYVDFKRALPQRVRLDLRELNLEAGPSYVRLGLSLVRVNAELRREILLIALASLAFIFVGVLIAFGLYKMILGPVEVLTESVKSFRHHRGARAHVRSGDELETLAVEFNKMADTIAEHDRRLERMNRQLLQANRVKSEFLAVMGHELLTPLHAIRGFSQLLLQGVDGPLTDEQRQDIQSILSSGDHLLELIDNVLRFSKLEAGEERLHPEALDAAQIVQEALQSVQSLAREKGITLTSRVPSIGLEADATKLKQILINLLSNAVKYTAAGAGRGRVCVSAEPRGEEVRFAVSDTGAGIPLEDRERIFEPFTQLDSSTTRESAGIGLGLAIVRKYVEMHGGRIWLEDNPEGGTTFAFALPQTLLKTEEEAIPEPTGTGALPPAQSPQEPVERQPQPQPQPESRRPHLGVPR